MDCPTKKAVNKLLVGEPKRKKEFNEGIDVIGGGVCQDPTVTRPNQASYGAPGIVLAAVGRQEAKEVQSWRRRLGQA